jgi:hypothetical protein
VWVDGAALVAEPSPHWSGNGTVTLTASDGREAASATTTFAVRPVDTPPSVVPPPPVFGEVGAALVVDIDATDFDGGALTFESSNSGPASMRALPVDASGRIAFVPPADMAGTWTFTIYVRDAANHTTAVPLTISVARANRAPQLVDLGVFELQRGKNATLHLAAVDPDGDPVTFSSSSPRALVATDGTVTLDRAQVAALPDGESVLTVAVSDGVSETSGFVRLRVVDAPASGGEYGADLAVLGTALAAICAAGAAAVWASRRKSVRR